MLYYYFSNIFYFSVKSAGKGWWTWAVPWYFSARKKWYWDKVTSGIGELAALLSDG